MAELVKSSPVIELCEVWFTSQNTGKIVIVNPENAPVSFTFEFKTPDLIVEKAILDNKVIREITITRMKEELKEKN